VATQNRVNELYKKGCQEKSSATTGAERRMPLELTPFFPRLTRMTMSGDLENTTGARNQE